MTRWLAAILAWLRRLFRRPRLLPGAAAGAAAAPDRWDPRVDSLDPDLRSDLDRLVASRGVVRDTVTRAVVDFCDLRDLIAGPGSFDVVGDLDLLGEAEAALRELVTRAPDVLVVVEVARERTGRGDRESAGAALLAFRDRGRALAEAVSAALRWSASRSAADRERLLEAAQALRRP